MAVAVRAAISCESRACTGACCPGLLASAGHRFRRNASRLLAACRVALARLVDVAKQLIEAPVAVEEIPQTSHQHLAGPEASGHLGQPRGAHNEVVAAGGQLDPLVEVIGTDFPPSGMGLSTSAI